MKRIVLSVCAAMVLFWGNADAQQYRAGIPWSQADQTGIIRSQTIPVISTETPDYARAREEDRINSGGRYRIGLNVPVDYDMNNSGVFTYLDNGSKIWRTAIRTAGAGAIDVTFDKFNLPKGVAMYLTNANGKQLEGSFTELDNTDNYSVPLIQGEVINIEVDIPAGIQPSDIDFIINTVCAYYRGGLVNDLNIQYGDYGNDQTYANEWEVTADPCHINAVCPPEAWDFYALKQTAAHIVMGGYVCSGNLINNTSLDCTPLFLTASHCDDGLGTTNTHFSSWKFYFNYEYPNCNGSGTASLEHYLTGAKFRARSLFTPVPEPQNPALIGDFLLLELRDVSNKLGKQFNAYLGGWDRATSQSGKFIDFHHPGGDPKKLSVFSHVQGNGTFNQSNIPSTHWSAKLEKGGIEGGSSGSALFSINTGRIIGDLSGGRPDSSACSNAYPSLYSKISRNWDYPEGEGNPDYRLKDHLDPAGTNANSLNTYKINSGNDVSCGETAVIINEAAALDEGISIYPNPSNGIVNLKVNLVNSTVLNIEVLNITGARTGVYKTTGKVQSGEVVMDLSALPNGIYLLRISSDRATVGKKVVLNR